MSAFRTVGRAMLIGAVVALVLVLIGLATSDVLVLVGGILVVTGGTFLVVQSKVFGDPDEHDRMMKLDLAVDGRTVSVGELVPIQHVHLLQVGGSLPVRVDGSGVVVVDWEVS